MRFEPPLENVQFLKRYKRFFADVELPSGEVLTVHVPNTGSMKGLAETPRPALISRSDSPRRKLKGTLEMVQAPSSWVGINTQLPNKLVGELLLSRKFEAWRPWVHHQAEVSINPKTRIDWVLSKTPLEKKLGAKDFQNQDAKTPLHLIEIKNVTMMENGVALFPDAPSERGRKHILELMDQARRGHSAELVFVVQREDCESFSPAKEIDALYCDLLKEAHSNGIKITPLKCTLNPGEVHLTTEVLPLKWP